MRNWKQIFTDIMLVVIAFAIAFVIMLMTAAIVQAQNGSGTPSAPNKTGWRAAQYQQQAAPTNTKYRYVQYSRGRGGRR